MVIFKDLDIIIAMKTQ